MSINTELLDEIIDITENVYADLNSEGVNISARKDVYLAVYETTGSNKYTRCPGAESLAPSTEQFPNPHPLVVVDLQIKDIISYSTGVPIPIGDARVKITQKTFSQEQLLGMELTENQKMLFLIDGEKYTIVDGQLNNVAGIFWDIVLKRVPL